MSNIVNPVFPPLSHFDLIWLKGEGHVQFFIIYIMERIVFLDISLQSYALLSLALWFTQAYTADH